MAALLLPKGLRRSMPFDSPRKLDKLLLLFLQTQWHTGELENNVPCMYVVQHLGHLIQCLSAVDISTVRIYSMQQLASVVAKHLPC